MMKYTALVPMAFLVAPVQEAVAAGNAAADAERARLAQEMRKLADRGAWRGVEANYNRMLDLERKGVELLYEDHLLGAQAARDLGRITQVYQRLERAAAVNETDEVKSWMADIESNYTRVDLNTDPRYKGKSALVPASIPLQPDQRAAIAAAQVQAEAGGAYVGLLPHGEYRFGEQSFQVGAGADVVRILLLPPELQEKVSSRAPRTRRDGLRLDLGMLYSKVGETESDGIQPQGFGGMGMRVGAGWEIQLRENIGLVAQGGYHGMMLGDANRTEVPTSWDLELKPVSDIYRDRLHLFYIWGGASWWRDELNISIGPSWAGGVAGTKGVVNDCLEGSGTECTESGAPWGGSGTDDIAVTGTVLTGGATVGVFYGLTHIPGMIHARGGISLQAGAQTDLSRWYPWAQVAFTVVPSI
jgi:hypothetical protein